MSGGAEFRKLAERVDALERRLGELEGELKPTDQDRAVLARLEAQLKSEPGR